MHWGAAVCLLVAPLPRGAKNKLIVDAAKQCNHYQLEEKLRNFQHYYDAHRTHADAKDTHRQRKATPIAHEQISVVIDGRSIVEAYIKRLLPPDFGNFAPVGRKLREW